MRPLPNSDMPLTFRADVVKPLIRNLAAGNSCSIVGVGSVGKSNMMRVLCSGDVLQAYLETSATEYLFVYVDMNKILKHSLWGLLELMLHQLMIELIKRGADESTLQTLDNLHQRATRPKTRRLALRYLDRAIGLVCDQLDLRLIFLIDEFDDLCRTMPPRGFAALRALRDEYKYRLIYVVATRLTLKRLRENISEIEAFEELVTPQTFWLGPYSEVDAQYSLHRLETRHNLKLEDNLEKELLKATGGHPGLLRVGYQVACSHPANFHKALAENAHIREECQRLWLSLAPDEQRLMVTLANGLKIPSDQGSIQNQLQCKGLIGGAWAADNAIFSSLFSLYVNHQPAVTNALIQLDHNRHSVWVNGHEVGKLTRLEYNLMAYFVEKRGQTCSRDELARHLYPKDMALEGEGVTDTRLDSLIKRLRKRIEPTPEDPHYILTVRGHGFRLDDEGLPA